MPGSIRSRQPRRAAGRPVVIHIQRRLRAVRISRQNAGAPEFPHDFRHRGLAFLYLAQTRGLDSRGGAGACRQCQAQRGDQADFHWMNFQKGGLVK